MKTIMVFSNHPSWTYNLRGEILSALVEKGYHVVVLVGSGKDVGRIMELGCEWIDVPFNRHGMNPIKEFSLFREYRKLLEDIKPDVVLSYTIKPNLYASYLCHKKGIPCIANITGLGTAVEYAGVLRSVLLFLYKKAFKGIYMVFFQNTMNRDVFIENNIVNNNYRVLPGSGVNLVKYKALPYPPETRVEFVFISRIMKEKGIEQYLDAAVSMKKKYPFTVFHICGFCEQNYQDTIDELSKKGIIEFHGMINNVPAFLERIHCLVLPTYYPEGMSNVLLEACASARPIITTNRPGCGEIVDDGINGFVVREKDSEDLTSKIEKFISLPYQEKVQMGMNGRRKVEKEFNRDIVVKEYIDAIEKAL